MQEELLQAAARLHERRPGLPVRLVFRIKDADAMRGFVRYFWKATPA